MEVRLSPRRVWILAVVVWSCIALFHYLQFFLQHLTYGRDFLWLASLLEFIVNYYSWLAIAYIIVRLGKRYRIQRNGWLTPLLVHFSACALLALAHIGIITGMLWTLKRSELALMRFGQVYVDVLLQLFHFEFLLYWVVLGLSYGYEFYVQRMQALPVSQATPNVKETTYLTTLPIKHDNKTLFLETERIDWLEASDNYIKVHTNKTSYLVRERMHVLERKLSPKRFQRIHRSIMINMDRLREIRRADDGTYNVVLHNNQILPISRRRQQKLRKSVANSSFEQ